VPILQKILKVPFDGLSEPGRPEGESILRQRSY